MDAVRKRIKEAKRRILKLDDSREDEIIMLLNYVQRVRSSIAAKKMLLAERLIQEVEESLKELEETTENIEEARQDDNKVSF